MYLLDLLFLRHCVQLVVRVLATSSHRVRNLLQTHLGSRLSPCVIFGHPATSSLRRFLLKVWARLGIVIIVHILNVTIIVHTPVEH